MDRSDAMGHGVTFAEPGNRTPETVETPDCTQSPL